MPPQPTGHRLLRLRRALLPSLGLALFAACGGSPTSPSPGGTTPSVTAVTPNSGTTLGGTTVSVTGSNFSAGATVSIGGTAATNVTVLSSIQLTATTGSHAAGIVDVTVAVGTRNGALAAAYTYSPPVQVTNLPPNIQSLVAQGTRSNEPPQFADLGEEIDVTATVEDKETPVGQLTYDWTTNVGTVTGTGAKVKWKAPASGTTPLVGAITLTVTEKYQTTDASGLPVSQENKVTGTTTVSVHDSVKEVGDMATLFLTNFSKTPVSADVVMKDFYPNCPGTDAEREDVERNRKDFVITSWDVQPAHVTLGFGGSCATVNGQRPGDACSDSKVRWDSTENASGKKDSVAGVDQIATVYRSDRWWLCSSDFDGHNLSGARFLGWFRH